ncbi:hypothetical protein [Myroides odoratimimus]|uniref:hypothetical protein n=1 Tax=Myroides odoratimimus TaxID=76832 RepID=UPI002DC052BF|nr:hypothetical protein [Myroides odoratimimus]MEC4083569.1 hypothetical protein [Myroides odoratimimus]
MLNKKITYRKEKGSRLTSNEVDQNFSYLDERIDKVSQKDYIIYNAGYTYNSTAVTASSGSVWLLDGEQYTNMMDFAFSIKPASKDRYRVDIIYMDKAGVIDIKTGIESAEGYIKDRVDVLEYLLVYVNELGIQSVSASIDGDYISKLSLGWVDVDHKKPVLEVTEQRSHINIVGGNVIIDTIANGIFEIAVPADFHDGYEVAIRNLRTSYVTLVNSSKLCIYTGQDYTLRPGEIVTFRYDKKNKAFAVSGALDVRLDWQNVDEIIGVDSMRLVVDSSAGDALNPNDLNTKLTPTILRYFKDYTSDAVGWQWSRFSGDETADKAWSKGKTKRILELTPADFTDAINKGNVSFMCEAVVNNATVAGVWVGKLVDTAKTIRIQSTGTQFKGKSPEYILLRAIANNIQVKKTEWFRDDVLTNIGDSMMVYNNQVSSFVVMKLRVTGADGVVYEDAITLSKVVDGTNGKPGVDGKQGAVVVWTEWMTGSKHYNNDKEIYYIYHRPTQTVWKLKDGYNDIVAPANPDARYVQQPHLEQVVTKVLVAEGANIAGFIFKDGKMVSQYPSPNNPDLILDGTRGEIIAKKLTIVPGSPADKFIDDKIGGIEVGGRNFIMNSGDFKTSKYWGINQQIANSKVDVINSLLVYDRKASGSWNALYNSTNFRGKLLNYSNYIITIRVKSSKVGQLRFRVSNLNGTKQCFYVGVNIVNVDKMMNYDVSVLTNHQAENYNDSDFPYFQIDFDQNDVIIDIENVKFEKGSVSSDWTPAIEDTEEKIQNQEMYYEYSVDGKTSWHYPLQNTDHYERRKKGSGVWSDALKITGEPGEKGKDGIQLYTWTRWADTPTSGISSNPEGKSYTGYAYNKTSNMPSMVYSDYQWQLSKGNPGKDGVPGEKGKDGIQLYTWVRWADTPTSGISASPDGKSYTGYAYNKTSNMPSMVYSDYQWQLSKGNPGKDGTPGAKGDDGQQLYNWVRYADTPTSGMSTSPTGKAYFGIAVNKPVITPSSNYADYQWQLTKGNPGDQGVPGKPGADGKTPIVHTAYSDSADGRVNFHLSDSTNRSWWGTYTDYISQDSNDPTKYKWMKTRGEPIASAVEPSGKYVGMIWVDTGKKPNEQKVWSGTSWELIGLSLKDIEIGGRNFIMNSGDFKTSKYWGINQQIANSKVDVINSLLVYDRKASGSWNALYNSTNFRGKLLNYSNYIITIRVKSSKVGQLRFRVSNLNGTKQCFYVGVNIVNVDKMMDYDVSVLTNHQAENYNDSDFPYFQIDFDQNDVIIDIENVKFEKGSVSSDWTPAIEDTEAELEAIREKNRQQEREINNLNNTTNILNQKTSYLTTTTTGNVVTTGTTEVGDANGNAKAGMTGVVSPNPVNISQNRRVVFYAGTGFANRENAKVQIWDDGKLVATDVLLTGTINANAGTFNNVTANNLTVNSGTFTGRVVANTGKIGNFTITAEGIENHTMGNSWDYYGISLQTTDRSSTSKVGIGIPLFTNEGFALSANAYFSNTSNGGNKAAIYANARGSDVNNHALMIGGGDISGMALHTVFKNNQGSYDITNESVYINAVTSGNTFSVGLPNKSTDRWDGRTVTIMMVGNGYWDIYPGSAALYLHESHYCGAGQKLHFGKWATRMTMTYVAGSNCWYITSINEY